MFFYTNLTVGMENYELVDDAGAGFDVKMCIRDRIWPLAAALF